MNNQIEEFKVLDDRNHILLRTQMYAGSTTCEPNAGIINFTYQEKTIVPALIKIIEEIFQNSIEEFIKTDGKFATEISLDITDTLDGTEITITDNGRGIPQELVNGLPRPVIAWTVLRAGTNFDDSNRKGASANGLGSVLTNILSKSFTGITGNGKTAVTVSCSDNMERVSHKVSKSNIRGTTVKFIPDLTRFGLLEFDKDHTDILRDRFNNLAILYPGIQFTFCSEKIKFTSIKHLSKKFHDSAVSYEQENVSMVFAPAGTQEEFRLLSYVNGIYIRNGGSHVDFVMNKVIENLREHIKKKFKIDVLPNGIRQHLLFASWMSGVNALKFDSQSKERVTNSVSEVSEFLKDVDFDKISRQILNTPEILDPMVASILYKKELAEKLALAKKLKSATKIRVVNHIAATDPDVEKRRLFIVEGLSACGPHISVRNPKTDGAIPLKGKVLNVRGMKPVDILKNKEIFELLSIIGLEFGKPATDLNYGKIVVFSDLDFDGSHIFGLLLNLFSNWPELFEQGRIFRCLAPLYYCTKGKLTRSFYTKEEFDKFNSKGWDIQFFKGLGSMPKEVYRECLQNSNLIQVSASDMDYNKLEMFFGDDVTLRKDWMTE